MLQANPSITHSDIAQKLDRSQPAIGARIKSLTSQGILSTQYGVNFNQIKEFNLVIIELTTDQPKKVLELVKKSPYIINILKLSGTSNILAFMACTSLKRIDYVVDKHFRKSKYISNVRMEMVTDFARKFVLPVNFDVEEFESFKEPIEQEQKPPKKRIKKVSKISKK
jgi:DNA-binding Lrp family transcriptional regulator